MESGLGHIVKTINSIIGWNEGCEVGYHLTHQDILSKPAMTLEESCYCVALENARNAMATSSDSESPPDPVWDKVINDPELLASMPLLGQEYFRNSSNKANGNKIHELIKSEMTRGFYPIRENKTVAERKPSCDRNAIMVIHHLNLDEYFHKNVVMNKFAFKKKKINGLTLIEPVHLGRNSNTRAGSNASKYPNINARLFPTSSMGEKYSTMGGFRVQIKMHAWIHYLVLKTQRRVNKTTQKRA
jgi:hypothetical protein